MGTKEKAKNGGSTHPGNTISSSIYLLEAAFRTDCAGQACERERKIKRVSVSLARALIRVSAREIATRFIFLSLSHTCPVQSVWKAASSR